MRKPNSAVIMHLAWIHPVGSSLASPVTLPPLGTHVTSFSRRTTHTLRMLDELDLIPPSPDFPRMLDVVDAVPRSQIAVLGPVTRTVRQPIEAVTVMQSLGTAPSPFDASMAVLLAVGLYLGPDFALAPLGLASKARVGYRAEALVGRAIPGGGGSGDWLADREAGLAASAPLPVRAATAALFGASGYLLERALSSLGNDNVIFYLGASSVLWGGLYEVARPRLPTRAEVEREEARRAEFRAFAEARLTLGSASQSTHESEVVRAFRRFYPKYRVDRGIADAEIADLMRRWISVPRTRLLPGGQIQSDTVSARTAAGYYKGIVLTVEPDVGLGR